MKNVIQVAALIGFVVFATGCFEIREEVDMNSDGSGRLTLTVNMSESKTNLASYMKMEEVQGVKVPTKEDILQEINRVKKALANSQGITNVSSSADFDNFIFKIMGDFDKVENLNNAINNVAQSVNRTPFETMKLDNFDYTTRSFRRYFNYPVSLIDYEELPMSQQYVLESARMVSLYRFERPIRTFTNEKAELAPDKKMIRLENSLGSIIKGQATPANSIIFQ
ncbi:MAG: hypothetical protein KDC44_12895 [Phaeodactylibacter sp.]|nr:hypothetical protein [Phaeodactylibacter sp.]